MKRLWITEKSSTISALRAFVGAGDVVLAASGHLLEPKEPGEIEERWQQWTVASLPVTVDPIPLRVGKGMDGKSHRDRLQRFKEAAARVQGVVVATDPGRAGSHIAWDILDWIKWKGPVQRLKLGATDPESVRRAISEMEKCPRSGEDDFAAATEARCRLFEDYHMGLNGSRAASLVLRPPHLRQVWSFGGAQTPTLALLADHERKIRDFVPTAFFKVAMGVWTVTRNEVVLTHAPKERIVDRAIATAIRDRAASWKGALKVVQRDGSVSPPRLHSKDSLGRKCAKMWGWAPDKTLKVHQALYDAGYLTYPRTEGRHLPESQIDQAASVLRAATSAVGLPAPDRPTIRKGQRGHYVSNELAGEHQAIVPTVRAPSRRDVSPDGWRLYEYLAKCFLAAHMPDGIDGKTSVVASVDCGPYGVRDFSADGRVVKVPGWRAAFGAEADDDESVPGKERDDADGGTGRLPPLADGESAEARRADVLDAETKPPPRITVGQLPEVLGRLIDQIDDADLKAALMNPANPLQPKGIGTGATRETFVPKLLRSGYIELMPGKDPPIRVIEAGFAFIDAVRARVGTYCEPVGRALFEGDLVKISAPGSRTEVLARAEAFRVRTKARVVEMVNAIRDGGAVSVSAAAAGSSGGNQRRTKGRTGGSGRAGGGRPTEKQVALVEKIGRERGLTLPAGYKESFAVASGFLDVHLGGGKGHAKRPPVKRAAGKRRR